MSIQALLDELGGTPQIVMSSATEMVPSPMIRQPKSLLTRACHYGYPADPCCKLT